MAAQVLAAAAGLGVAGEKLLGAHPEPGVALERRQPRAARRQELELLERDQRAVGGPVAQRVGIRAVHQPPCEASQAGLELAAQEGVDAEGAQVALVQRGVEPVGAQVGRGVERAHPRDLALGQAGRGVHGQEERHQVGGANRPLVQRLDREVEAAHRRSLALEPGSGRGEAEGLAAEIVGRDEEGVHGKGRVPVPGFRTVTVRPWPAGSRDSCRPHGRWCR